MRTGGARAALGVGAALGLALLTVTGCGGSASRTASAPTPTPVPTPASGRPAPPEDLCARLVAHWSREVLDTDTYGDYQSMGLSNGQYEILIGVVDAARAARKREGPAAADELIDRRARRGCVEWYRDGGPGDGPWQ
ncbi:hypothetical protein ACIPSE_18910 [Streptomyces sp. NPDC090106]|uniref:hypothetical protein n=1 Tax=Streptomyces sp. NPDC090106 TaxID=3365946 RepID=UPI00381D5518